MKELKKGWANSAHLMTVQQLLNWRNVMQCNFASELLFSSSKIFGNCIPLGPWPF